MQPQRLNSVLSASVLIITAAFIFPKSADAQKTTFFCDLSNSVPTTMARNDRRQAPLIRWVSNFGSQAGYTAQQRCLEVSNRFQEYYDMGKLKFLTTGRINGQNVVCVAERVGGACAGLLFTLKPTSNPSKTLENLLDIRTNAGASPLNESYGRVYIDLDRYLQQIEVQ